MGNRCQRTNSKTQNPEKTTLVYLEMFLLWTLRLAEEQGMGSEFPFVAQGEEREPQGEEREPMGLGSASTQGSEALLPGAPRGPPWACFPPCATGVLETPLFTVEIVGT